MNKEKGIEAQIQFFESIDKDIDSKTLKEKIKALKEKLRNERRNKQNKAK